MAMLWRAWVPTRHLMGCGLGDCGAKQIVADHVALSVSAVPASEPLQGFFRLVRLGLTHIHGLFRGVALGSHLRAWTRGKVYGSIQ